MTPLSVDGVLGPEGAIRRALKSYEHRPSQVRLARAVEKNLAEGGILLAEAGTGTGKTLAYLVPALLSGKKVIVSTATRNLQDQLLRKDLPLLGKTGLEGTTAVLKGRSNYVCALKFELFDTNPLFKDPAAARFWPEFRRWVHDTTSGDRADSQVPDDWEAWPTVSTTTDSCLGTQCSLYDSCFVTQARAKAKEAQLIIVNHALFFADLALKWRGGDEGLGVLPEVDAVVFDEAHAIEDVATEHFGLSVSSARLESLSQDAMKALTPVHPSFRTLSSLAFSLGDASKAFFHAAATTLGLTDREARVSKENTELLETDAERLTGALEALAALVSKSDEGPAQLVGRRALDLATTLNAILHNEDRRIVCWGTRKGRLVSLKAAPIDVGFALQKTLFEEVKSVVMTSATLTAGASASEDSDDVAFHFSAQRLGLVDRPHDSLRVDSPFDYRRQAALYVAGDLPDPSSPRFADAFADEAYELIQITQGRAFVLFTSLAKLDQVSKALRDRLEWPVLVQGERPKAALLEDFQKQPSVLFGSSSFWEGVDVPGDALSLVIIDKIPFAPPNTPLEAARIDAINARGGNAFGEYQLPQAALALKQGFGRLIRTRTDVGIVALCDSRLVNKRYGATLLEGLPPATRVESRQALAAWWSKNGHG